MISNDRDANTRPEAANIWFTLPFFLSAHNVPDIIARAPAIPTSPLAMVSAGRLPISSMAEAMTLRPAANMRSDSPVRSSIAENLPFFVNTTSPASTAANAPSPLIRLVVSISPRVSTADAMLRMANATNSRPAPVPSISAPPKPFRDLVNEDMLILSMVNIAPMAMVADVSLPGSISASVFIDTDSISRAPAIRTREPILMLCVNWFRVSPRVPKSSWILPMMPLLSEASSPPRSSRPFTLSIRSVMLCIES